MFCWQGKVAVSNIAHLYCYVDVTAGLSSVVSPGWSGQLELNRFQNI